ncbi:hypothetical protein AB9C34_20175, partial [Escherichia coli]
MGTYVTNTGLMATYGGQFTLTMYLASEALCRVLACPVLVRTRHRWSCQRQDYWPFFAIFNVRYWSLMLSAFRHFIITDWRGVF